MTFKYDHKKHRWKEKASLSFLQIEIFQEQNDSYFQITLSIHLSVCMFVRPPHNTDSLLCAPIAPWSNVLY